MATTQGKFSIDFGMLGRFVGWRTKQTISKRGGHSSTRSKYFILSGDTLELIAERSLGDARLLGLLVTINRAQVRLVQENGKQVPYVQPGETIYLPTREEIEIYRSNFLVRRAVPGSMPAEPESTIEVDYWDDDEEESQQPAEEEASEATGTVFTQSDNEFHELFEPDDIQNSNVNTVRLAEYVRVFVAQSPVSINDFSVRLQANVMGTWRTIAAYYARSGRIARVLYRIDGRRKQIDVELPEASVREMAEDDFTRNWERHYRGYMMQKPSSLWLEFPAKTI